MSVRGWLWGLGIGGVAFGAIYLYRKNEAGGALEVTVKPMIHTVAPLVVRADVQLKNAGKTPLTIKYPFVQLKYKDMLLGSSEVRDMDITLDAFKTVNLTPPIMITIPALGLFSIGGTLLSDLASEEKVNLTAYTRTYVYLGGTLKLIEKTEEISLKKTA